MRYDKSFDKSIEEGCQVLPIGSTGSATTNFKGIDGSDETVTCQN